MALWLSELLADAALGLELVAGHAGLAERGPVGWAHVSELPEPTPWLEGGEVLLTTGLAVKDDPDLQRRLVAGLDARGCAGLGFGLGIWLDRVPAALVEEADARRLPLFTVPYAVPFTALSKRVALAVAAEQYAVLRGAVDLHRRVLAEVVGGAGLDGVLRLVAERLPGRTCVAFDYYGQVLSRHGPRDVADADLWRAVSPAGHPQARPETVARDLGGAQRFVTAGVARLGDEVEAVLVAVGDRWPSEGEVLLFEQGLAGLNLELARGLSVREARRARVDELLEELLAGRATGALLASRLARLGLDPAAGYHVLCLRRPAGVAERVLCAVVEDVLGAEGRPVLGRDGGLVYAVVQPSGSAAAERIAAAAAARGWRGLAIGRSRPRGEPDGLVGAVREARAAAVADAAGGVRDVTALGLTGLLAGVGDTGGPEAFVAAVLGPLLDHDARESSALTDSLRAYLRAGCRPGPAAGELRVHRHTLAYRLDRIRDLTGRDPRDGAHLTEYGVALELLAHGVGAGA